MEKMKNIEWTDKDQKIVDHNKLMWEWFWKATHEMMIKTDCNGKIISNR